MGAGVWSAGVWSTVVRPLACCESDSTAVGVCEAGEIAVLSESGPPFPVAASETETRDTPALVDEDSIPAQPVLLPSPSVVAACKRLPVPRDINIAVRNKSALAVYLPQLSVEQVTELVLGDGLFQRYMRDVQGSETTKMSPWQPCLDVPGSHVRTARCLIPLPQDVPAAVARTFVKIPEVAEASMSWRVMKVENGLDAVLHNMNTDVPFGDRFIVQVVCRVRRHEEGGCVLSKSVSIRWVKPFSWSLKVIQKVIDYQVGVKARAMDPAFAAFLKGLEPK